MKTKENTTLREKIENYKENAKFGRVSYNEDYFGEKDFQQLGCSIYPLDDEDGYYTDDRLDDFYKELEKFEINIDDFEMINSDGNSLEFSYLF